MTTHHLKTWPPYFWAVKNGSKTFEVRKNDRYFCEDDILVLEEYSPTLDEYTGESVTKKVGFILSGQFGIPEDICVMSLLDIEEGPISRMMRPSRQEKVLKLNTFLQTNSPQG